MEDNNNRNESIAALAEREANLRNVIMDSAEGILVTDEKGVVLFANPAAESILGNEKGRLKGEKFNFPDTGEEKPSEVDLVKPDGSALTVEFWARKTNWNGTPAIRVCVRDLTEHKQIEGKVSHLNAVLYALRIVNQLITREKDRDELVKKSCEILVSTRGYYSAWGALHDREGRFETIAESGIGNAFKAFKEQVTGGKWPSCYKDALAAETGILAKHNHIRKCHGCKLARLYRKNAALAGALRYNDHDFGVLVVTLPVGMAYDKEEQTLFKELVGDIAYALYAIEVEEEKQRAERQKLELLTKYKTLFSIYPMGVTLADVDGKIVESNRIAEEILGLSEKEQKNRHIEDYKWNVIRPDGTQLPPDEYASVRAMKENRLIENVQMGLVKNNNEITWISVSAIPIPLEKFGVLITYLDISEQKKAEQELKERERQLSLIYSSVAEALYVIDVEPDNQFRFKSVNQAFLEATGLRRELVEGRLIEEVIPESSIGMVRGNYLKAIHEKGVLRWEETSRYPSGAKTGIVNMAPVFDKDGNCINLVGSVHDITERKQAEEQLSRAQELLKETSEMAQVGGWEIDMETDTVTYTHGTRLTHEVPEDYVPTLEEAIGFFPDARKELTEAIRRAREEGIPYDMEVPFVTAKGRGLWTHTRGKAVFEDGKCVRLYGTFQDITEQKKIRDTLEETNLRFQETVRGGNVGLWDWDLPGNRVYYSPEWKAQIGYREEEISDNFEEWRSRVHPEDLPDVMKVIERLIAGKSDDCRVDFRCRHKDGSWRWIVAHAAVLRDVDGKVVRLVGSHVDITQLKQAEEQIRIERDRAQMYLDIARVIIIAIDSTGTVQLINRMGCDILGYSAEEIIGRNWFDNFLPPETSEETLAVHDAILAGDNKGRTYKENLVLTKSGAKRLIAWQHVPLMDDEGNVTGHLSSGTDITEQKRAETSLRESEERFRTISECSADPIFITDRDARYVYVNKKASELLGYSQKELLKMGIPDVVIPEKITESTERFKQLVENGAMLLEIHLQRKDGTTVPVELNSVVLPNGLIYGSCRDITERKQTEMEIEKNLKEKELLLKELYHRTKNNMQVISSMLRLKARSSENEWLGEAFKEIENKIMGMALVHQKLYESKDLSHINLKEYIESLLSLIKTSYYGILDNISIKADLKEIDVLIDSAIPVGVIINELFTNSVKHAFPDDRKGKIEVTLDADPKGLITIEIKDNGIGLPKNFDLKKDINLGLQTVIGLIESQLDGKVSFKSRNGLHCRFTFEDEQYKTRI